MTTKPRNCRCGGEAKLVTTSANQDGPGCSHYVCTKCGAQSGIPTKNFWRCRYDGVSEADAIALHDAEALEKWQKLMA